MPQAYIVFLDRPNNHYNENPVASFIPAALTRLGHLFGMFQIAKSFFRRISTVSGRIIENAKPYIVESMILQNFDCIFLNSVIGEF